MRNQAPFIYVIYIYRYKLIMALIFKIILAILGIWFFVFTFTSLANFFNVPVEQYGNYLFFIVVLMIL